MERMNDSRSIFDDIESMLDAELGDYSKEIDKNFDQANSFGNDAWDTVMRDIDIPEVSRRGPEMLSRELRAKYTRLDPAKVDESLRKLYDTAAKASAFSQKRSMKDERELLRQIPEEDKEMFDAMLASLAPNRKKGWLSGAGSAIKTRHHKSIENIVRFMATREDQEELDRLAESTAIKQAGEVQTPTGAVQRGFIGAAGMVPDLGLSMATGAALGPAGTAVTRAGQLAYWTAQSSPEIRDTLIRAGVDKDAATQAGLIGGALVAGVELLQFKGLSKPFTKEVREVFMDSTKEIIRKSLIEGGKEFGKQWTEEMVQQAITEGTQALVRWMTEQGYSEEEKKQVLQNFTDTATETALSLPFLMLPGQAFDMAAGNMDAAARARFAKERLLSDEGVASFVQVAPDASRIIAFGEPTRANFAEAFGKEDMRWNQQERTQLKEMLRTALDYEAEQQAIPEVTEDQEIIPEVTPEQEIIPPTAEVPSDQENQPGIPSIEPQGQESGRTVQEQGTGAEETARGRNVQENGPQEGVEEVKPISQGAQEAFDDLKKAMNAPAIDTTDETTYVKPTEREQKAKGWTKVKGAFAQWQEKATEQLQKKLDRYEKTRKNKPNYPLPSNMTVDKARKLEEQHDKAAKDLEAFWTKLNKDQYDALNGTDINQATYEEFHENNQPKKAAQKKKKGLTKQKAVAEDVPEYKNKQQVEFLPTERSSKHILGRVTKYIGDGAYEVKTYPSKNLAKVETFVVDKKQMRLSARVEKIKQNAAEVQTPFITETAIQKDKDMVDAMATLQGNIPVSMEDARALDEDAVSTQEIVTFLSKAFEIPIRFGRVSVKGALGIYQRIQELARVKGTMYGDISVSTHEVAHHLDKTLKAAEQLAMMTGVEAELRALDYEPNRKNRTTGIREGFAEFMRYYVTMPDALKTKAPATLAAFEKFMKQHAKQWDNVQKLQKMVQTWVNQGALKRIEQQMTDDAVWDKLPKAMDWKPQVRGIVEQTSDWLYTHFKDAFHQYWKLGKQAAKKGFKGMNPGALAQTLSMLGPTFAMEALQRGVMTYEYGQDAKGNTDYSNFKMKRLGGGLQEILMEFPSKEERKDLSMYAYAKHALDVHRSGINPGISEKDAQYAVTELRKKRGEKIERGQKALTEFNNNLVRMMADVGVITTAERDAMINTWKNYVPLRRAKLGIMQGIASLTGRATTASGMVNQPGAFKSLKGTSLPVVDPLYSTVQRAIEFYERANKQAVSNLLVQIARDTEGMNDFVRVQPNMRAMTATVGELLEGLDKSLGPVGERMMTEGEKLDPDIANAIATIYRPDYTPNMRDATVRVIVDGKPQLFEVDRSLYLALTGMDAIRLPKVLDFVFAAPTRLAKLGMTGISTSFAISNPIADYFAYLLKTREGGAGLEQFIAPPAWILRYAKENMKEIWTGKMEDPFIELYKMFGGEMNHMLGMDVNKIKNTLKQISGDTRKQRLLNVVTLDGLRAALGVSEAGPRLAEFSMAMRRHGYDADTLRTMLANGEYPPMSVMTDAMLKAADVTTNFKRLGTWGKYINHVIPYFNARYESIDSMIRNYKDNPKRALAATAMLAMASALYWWARHDDDDYKEQDYWLKYGYWTWKDPVYGRTRRIKKPHEFGWVVSGLVEGMLDKAFEQDPKAVTEWFKYVEDQINPVTMENMPLAVKPLMEALADKDTFRGNRPVVPLSLKQYKPEHQYRETTAWLSKRLGQATGISPMKIDHILNAYTGGMTTSFDRFGRGLHDEFTDVNAADMPFLKAFAVRDLPSKSIQEMYERLESVSQEIRSQDIVATEELKEELGRRPTPEEIDKRAASKVDDAMRQEKQRLEAAARQMRDLRKSMEDMSNDEAFAVHKQMIGIARQAIGAETLKSFQAPTNEQKLRSSLRTLSRERPSDRSKVSAWEQQQEDAIAYIKSSGISQEDALKFYRLNISKELKDQDTRFDNNLRVKRNLRRLNQ